MNRAASGMTSASPAGGNRAAKRLALRRFAAVAAFFALWAAMEYCARYFTLPLTQSWPMIREDRAAVEGEIDTVFVGASLFRNGIIPSLFDDLTGSRSFNGATSRQSIELSRYALEDFSESNPLDLALIDTSVNRLQYANKAQSDIAKHILLSHLTNLKAKALLLRGMFTVDELPLTVLSSARNQLHYFWGTLSERLTVSYLKDYLTYGYGPDRGYNAGSMGYTPDSTALSSDSADAADPSPDSAAPQALDGLEPLERLIAECLGKGIRPVLVSMPTTDVHMRSLSGYDAMMAQVKALAQRKGVLFLDFKLSKFRVVTLDAAHFSDTRHLNSAGAALFTPHLAEVLQKALSGQDVSDYFYDSYDRMLEAMS